MSTQPALRDEIFQEVTTILNQPDFKRWGEEVKILAADCLKVKVKDDESERLAVDKVSQVRGLRNRLEEKRKEVTGKYRKIFEAVNNGVRDWTGPLDRGESHIKAEIKNYHAALEMKRLKEEEEARKKTDKLRAKVEKESAKLGIETPDIPPPTVPKRETVVRGSMGKVGTHKIWVAELVDLMELVKAVAKGKAPQQLLEVNQQFANSMVKAKVREIPGFKIYQKDTISVHAT